MRRLGGLQLPSFGKQLQPILPQGLQHQEARLLCLLLALLDEAVIQQRGEGVQDVWAPSARPLAKRLGCRKLPAARKDREPPEERLLLGRKQVVAPLERLAQRLLASRRGAWPAGEQRQALREAKATHPGAHTARQSPVHWWP